MNTRLQGRNTSRRFSLTALAPLLVAALANAQVTTRVSVDSLGAEADQHSDYPALSKSGRLVVFESQASNLVAGDLNGNGDVFVHDRLNGTTVRASVDSLGLEGDGPSREPAISGDGRYVAFQSAADNLVPGDTNLTWDVFVHDLVTGATERISLSTAGVQANGISGTPALSADGRFVAFTSSATNLVAGDTNNQRDVFLRDRLLGTTERVDVDSVGAQALGGASDLPSISADGSRIVFTSAASNLVPGDSNAATDVFLRDLSVGATIRISVNELGNQISGASTSPALSADGTTIAFTSSASNVVAGDNNAASDVFLRDLYLSTTTRVSLGFNAAQPNGPSLRPSISANGQQIVFQSSASNIQPGDANGAANDVFLYDRATSTTTLVGLSFDGRQVSDGAEFAALAADGFVVAFTSFSFKMVPDDQNSTSDVFVRDWAPLPPPPVSYCNGDGSVTPCPCANDAPAGTLGGCVNSLGFSGQLSVQGQAHIGLDSLVLIGTGLPNSTALFLQGSARENSGAGTVFGDGLQCLSGSIMRLGMRTAVGNTASTPLPGGPPISVRGACRPGDVRQYQIYYRNAAAAFCTSDTFNLSNAWEITWAP